MQESCLSLVYIILLMLISADFLVVERVYLSASLRMYSVAENFSFLSLILSIILRKLEDIYGISIGSYDSVIKNVCGKFWKVLI